jgi:hypothetical protein
MALTCTNPAILARSLSRHHSQTKPDRMLRCPGELQYCRAWSILSQQVYEHGFMQGLKESAPECEIMCPHDFGAKRLQARKSQPNHSPFGQRPGRLHPGTCRGEVLNLYDIAVLAPPSLDRYTHVSSACSTRAEPRFGVVHGERLYPKMVSAFLPCGRHLHVHAAIQSQNATRARCIRGLGAVLREQRMI